MKRKNKSNYKQGLEKVNISTALNRFPIEHSQNAGKVVCTWCIRALQAKLWEIDIWNSSGLLQLWEKVITFHWCFSWDNYGCGKINKEVVLTWDIPLVSKYFTYKNRRLPYKFYHLTTVSLLSRYNNNVENFLTILFWNLFRTLQWDVLWDTLPHTL